MIKKVLNYFLIPDRFRINYTFKGAMFALKRKKLLVAEITKIQGAAMTLAKQQSALESAAFNIQIFGTLQEGAAALKAVHGEL